MVDRNRNEVAQLLLTEYPPVSVVKAQGMHRRLIKLSGYPYIRIVFSVYGYMIKRLRMKKSIISFPVDRRSVHIMEGIAWSEWERSTDPVKNNHYSITVRTLRK